MNHNNHPRKQAASKGKSFHKEIQEDWKLAADEVSESWSQNMKKPLFVMLGDVVGSRNLQQRDQFRKDVERVLDEINNGHSNHIYAPFKLIKGLDEIGGVLSDISPVYKIICSLTENLYPTTFKLSLVFDYVDVAVESKDVSKMDGPAFHKAVALIEKIKKTNLTFWMSSFESIAQKKNNHENLADSSLLPDSESSHLPFDNLKFLDYSTTNQINLFFLLKKHWSKKQIGVLREYKKAGNQRLVAEKLDITQQAVSETLRTIMWKDVAELEDNFNVSLSLYSGFFDHVSL